MTFQIKKSQDIRPGRYYGNYYNFARFNRFIKRRTKRSRKKKKDKKSKDKKGKNEPANSISSQQNEVKIYDKKQNIVSSSSQSNDS